MLNVLITLCCIGKLALLPSLDILRHLAMPLQSDLTIDASKFERKLADEQTKEFNEKLIKIWADGPRWYEVSSRQIASRA